MGKNGNLKRQMESELAFVSKTAILVAAAVSVTLGILFALSCVDKVVYFYTFQPRCGLSPFFAVLLWILAYAIYGASCALLVFAGRCSERHYNEAVILSFAVLVLSYVWLPVVYKAASFLLATLLVAVILVGLIALMSFARRISKLATVGLLLYTGWIGYILYYTFSLFLIN